HTRFSRDWSSDVCSSDLSGGLGNHVSAGRVVLNPWNHNVTSNYRDWNAPFAYDQVPFAAGPVSSRTTPANGVVLVLTSRSQNSRSEERRVGKGGKTRWTR